MVFLIHALNIRIENRRGSTMQIGYARVSTEDQHLDLQRRREK